ncbi:MAG: alanine--tRNA ligase [Clostridia bacterium]|nr:alanine--tRNA ligase [Clostridia bacterium]
MTIKEFKKKWITFNIEKGHIEIENASVVPADAKGALFTVAGMHPLVPYLMGKEHPAGVRLTNSQRCIRTNDIDSVGDKTHCTFFEMLGTWSLGNYFKEKAIKDSYDFLTSPNYLNLPKDKIAVTVFEGDDNAPKDIESYNIWKSCGLDDDQIFFLGKSDNWWAMGETGPCGPDTEMFFVTDAKCDDKNCSPSCDCGKYIEIGNNVFIQYVVENEGEKPKPLPQTNVDRGMGLERVVMALNGFDSVYELDVFKNAIALIESLAGKKYLQDKNTIKAYRVIAEHLRTSTVILGDNNKTVPSNVGRGYILRRLIRRAVRFSREIELDASNLQKIAEYYIDFYKDDFLEFVKNKNFIFDELNSEIERFNKTLSAGLKEFEKVMTYVKGGVLPGKTAFRLYDTFGFPLEITTELAEEKGFKVDEIGYHEAFKKHQEASRGVEEGVFKGGLADTSYQTTKYHTATHLTLAALRQIYGENINQMGANLTSERMRFDFNLDRKMTDVEICRLEDIVNEQIRLAIPVIREEMNLQQAKKSGALGIFEDKYGEVVSVYTIGDFSKEICGGPHVKNTSELGKYKIDKEQSSSRGVRRIRAILL